MQLLHFPVLVKAEQKRFKVLQREAIWKDRSQNMKNHKNHAN